MSHARYESTSATTSTLFETENSINLREGYQHQTGVLLGAAMVDDHRDACGDVNFPFVVGQRLSCIRFAHSIGVYRDNKSVVE
jgi:hypothetical protein